MFPSPQSLLTSIIRRRALTIWLASQYLYSGCPPHDLALKSLTGTRIPQVSVLVLMVRPPFRPTAGVKDISLTSPTGLGRSPMTRYTTGCSSSIVKSSISGERNGALAKYSIS